jgi:pimeloyl-ACP methyl ester carboxylesterase
MSKDIVLIPGTLATPKIWQNQEHYFQDDYHFHHVSILDIDSIYQMAERYISYAPNKFTLIAFSMGGYVALELYRLIPDRIEKLILINSAARELSPEGKEERKRSIDFINKGKFDFLISLIFKNSIHGTKAQKNLLPLLQSMAVEVGAENYKNQLYAMINKNDHSYLLPKIKCPTLILCSKNDNVMPAERSQHLANNIKNSELIYLEECGHMAMLEQPEKLNRILSAWL